MELRGRVTSAPTERELPERGGDQHVPAVGAARPHPDDVRLQPGLGLGGLRRVERAQPPQRRRLEVGDQVEVSGALRRRFYRAGEGSSTRLEVEVLGARRARSRDRPDD